MAGDSLIWFSGRAGERWRNGTASDCYQFEASPFPCVRCLYHDRLIATADPGELHPHCKCERVRIAPGELAPRVFRSFATALAQRPDLVGKHRRRLLRSGSVSWASVVDELAAVAR